WFLFSSRRRHTSLSRDWSSDVCSSDLSQIRLHGLAGDPSWGAHPENALNVLRFAKDELALKRIQFDVEVWALDEWDADQSDTLRSLLELAEMLSADPSIDVGFAIPFWFDRQSDAVDS